MLFSLLNHYLDTDTALKVSQSVYCFTTSISHGVEDYFPSLWGTGISDAICISIEISEAILINIKISMYNPNPNCIQLPFSITDQPTSCQCDYLQS